MGCEVGAANCIALAIESTLFDKCTILTPIEAQESDGQITHTYAEDEGIPCRWSGVSSSENPRQSYILASGVWTMVVPMGTSITYESRVKLTHKMGAALDVPIAAAVDGDPQIIVGALRVNLKAIKT